MVAEVRELLGRPECLWLQIDVGGGWWASCDALADVDDGYVAAGKDIAGVPPLAPQVALSIRAVAEELGVPVDDKDNSSDSDVDMGLSP